VILTLDAAEAELWSGGVAPASVAYSSIVRAQALASSALDEARDVAARLRPARIHEIGLGAALVNLARDAGMVVDVRFDPAVLPPGLLGAETEIDAYRVVQEALSNAARHSGASSVWIDATVKGPEIVLEVGDDGRGLDPLERGEGLGLAGMEERAAILTARLDIRSSPGRGTVVRLIIPIQHERDVPQQPLLADVRSGI